MNYTTVIKLTDSRVITFGPAPRADVVTVELAVARCMRGEVPSVEIHGNNGKVVRATTAEILSVGV